MPSTTQPEHQHQSATQARAALYEWVFEQVDSDNRQWLMDEINTLALVESFDNDAHAIKQFDIAFGLIPRRIDRNLLTIDKTAKEKAQTILPGWQPWTWQLDEAARILLVASAGNKNERTQLINRIARHADVAEQLAIFKGLMLYPVDDSLMNLVGDGLRTNMSVVFEAIAHHNPFPAMHFDEHQFNHMVLKAFFIETPLHPIVGLMQRNNAELARMCLDYASERMAAGRYVSWELWRLVAPLATPDAMEKFKPLLEQEASDRDTMLSQKGLALALTDPTLPNTLDGRNLSWNSLLLESTGT